MKLRPTFASLVLGLNSYATRPSKAFLFLTQERKCDLKNLTIEVKLLKEILCNSYLFFFKKNTFLTLNKLFLKHISKTCTSWSWTIHLDTSLIPFHCSVLLEILNLHFIYADGLAGLFCLFWIVFSLVSTTTASLPLCFIFSSVLCILINFL